MASPPLICREIEEVNWEAIIERRFIIDKSRRRGRELGGKYWKYHNQIDKVYADNGYLLADENHNGEGLSRIIRITTRNSPLHWQNATPHKNLMDRVSILAKKQANLYFSTSKMEGDILAPFMSILYWNRWFPFTICLNMIVAA